MASRGAKPSSSTRTRSERSRLSMTRPTELSARPREDHPTWQQAVDALAELLKLALEQLARISGRVRRDAALARAWNERASAEPTSIFASVCADLAVTFNDGLAAILIRNVERGARRLRPGEDVRAAVEALCAEEITNQAKRLPVPYHAVLDRLGLIGRQQAGLMIAL